MKMTAGTGMIELDNDTSTSSVDSIFVSWKCFQFFLRNSIQSCRRHPSHSCDDDDHDAVYSLTSFEYANFFFVNLFFLSIQMSNENKERGFQIPVSEA